MKKISFFGLVLAFMTMAIFIVSCSQPLYPHGSTYPPRGNGDEGSDIPGWEDGGSGGGRKTVVQQLDWLRENAPAGTVWYVWAWMRNPYETINVRQNIHGVGDSGITVYLRTCSGYTGPGNRRRLKRGSNITMLYVYSGSRLILENIVLQGRTHPTPPDPPPHVTFPLVFVNAGTLEKRNGSEIYKDSPNASNAVRLVNRAALIMSGNALIDVTYDYPLTRRGQDGVELVNGSSLTMSDTANIINGRRGVYLVNSTLTMIGSAHISGHRWEGVIGRNISTISMYNSTAIRANNNADDVANSVYAGVNLLSSNLTMRNSAQIHSNANGGGVFAALSLVRMFDNASIHYNIHRNTGSSVTWGSGGVSLNASRLYMYSHGVQIRGNSTESSRGGGVRVCPNSVLSIHGGLIYGNEIGVITTNRNVNASVLPPPAGHALFVDTGGTVRHGTTTVPLSPNYSDITFGVNSTGGRVGGW